MTFPSRNFGACSQSEVRNPNVREFILLCAELQNISKYLHVIVVTASALNVIKKQTF